MSRSGVVIGRIRSARSRGSVGAVAPDEIIVPDGTKYVDVTPYSTPYYANPTVEYPTVTAIQIDALRAAATIKIVGTTLGAGAGYFLGSKKHAGWKNIAAGAALGNIVSGAGLPIVGTAIFAGLGAGIAYLAGKKPVTGALAGAGASAALATVASVVVMGAAPTAAQRIAGMDHVAGLSVSGFGFGREWPRKRWEKDQKKKADAAAAKKDDKDE